MPIEMMYAPETYAAEGVRRKLMGTSRMEEYFRIIVTDLRAKTRHPAGIRFSKHKNAIAVYNAQWFL